MVDVRVSSRKSRTFTWKKLQTQSAASFQAWLNAGRRDADIVRIQQTLTAFLLEQLSDRAEVRKFIAAWPCVMGSSCNDARTYLVYENVLAYCHIHFLERYRRFYQVLERLYEIGHLPMRDSEVRVLDVGTGPAPCLYAFQDFYDQIRGFANFRRLTELHLNPPVLNCVEQSPAMERFMHHFSERTLRPRPFGATHRDFLKLDLSALRRASEEESRKSQESDWDDPGVPWPFDPVDYKHDLYIFSNFLTTREFAATARNQLLKIFYWLGPGQRLLIMGSSAHQYDEIYDFINGLASQASVDGVDGWNDSFSCTYKDFSAQRIKAQYDAIVSHITKLDPRLRFPQELQKTNDLWDPKIRLRGPRSFRARLYRRTRLLRGRRWRRAYP
jgi:hypothetical protein